MQLDEIKAEGFLWISDYDRHFVKKRRFFSNIYLSLILKKVTFYQKSIYKQIIKLIKAWLNIPKVKKSKCEF